MLGFGTGGSIQSSPEGLWRMEVDGTEVGRYDLALAAPVKDGKPQVFLPQAKFIKTGTKITGVEVELHRWNGTAYELVTDLAPVQKLVTEFMASVTRASDNAELRAKLTLNEDGTITGKYDGKESNEGDGKPSNPAVAASDVSSFAISFVIGNASYRMEFRD